MFGNKLPVMLRHAGGKPLCDSEDYLVRAGPDSRLGLSNNPNNLT